MNSTLASTRPVRSTVRRERAVFRGQPLHAFIAYSDLPAARRATLTILDALRSAARKFELQPMLWRFDQLASAHWRDRAVDAALKADVVVLASSEPGTLPTQVEDWVHAFLARNHGRPVTIVAVSGESDAWTISIEEPRPEPAALLDTCGAHGASAEPAALVGTR